MIARIGLAIALAVGIAAWMWSGTLVVSGSAEEAKVRPPSERSSAQAELFRVRVRTIRSETREQTLTMRGRTRADALVTVAAETTGRVHERLVSRGSTVEAGDVLCRLDRGVREAELAKAEAEAAKAQLEFDAASKLQGRGFESQTRVAATRASLDAANAAVAAAKRELEHTIVRAPISGNVQEPLAEVGNVLSVGGICATIVDADPIVVTGQVTERDVSKIAHGARVDIELVTGESVEGAVSYISRTGREETRTFTVEVRIPNDRLTLRAGVTAEAFIPLDPVVAHRLSPGVLTLSDAGRIGVRTVSQTGMVAFIPVKIAGQDADGFWVTGLPSEVTVITVGQDYVVDGQRVSPEQETAATGSSQTETAQAASRQPETAQGISPETETEGQENGA
ncbi:MAG: efflux RND transporter periplasmic adaptor subunit [Pseudomonadota bacterium]